MNFVKKGEKMLYESKVSLHFDEIEALKSNGIQSLINKLESIKSDPNSRQLKVIRLACERLADIDAEKVSENIGNYLGVYYSRSKSMWIGQIKVYGKSVYIKGSKDKQVVINAYEKFVSKLKKD